MEGIENDEPQQPAVKSAAALQREMDLGLWTAAGKGKLAEVEKLKGKGANPSWFNPWEPPGRLNQFNSLHMAAGQGHAEVVKYLVDKCGVDINAKCVVLALPPPHRT